MSVAVNSIVVSDPVGVITGAVVSSVMSTAGDGSDVLTPSDALAVNELPPSSSSTPANEKFPESSAVVVPAGVTPLNSCIVAPASVEVPSIVIGVEPTVAGGVVIAGTGGGVVSVTLYVLVLSPAGFVPSVEE